MDDDMFTIEELEGWLWENVLNNSGNEFGDSVEILIGRLDGFRQYVRDKREEE